MKKIELLNLLEKALNRQDEYRQTFNGCENPQVFRIIRRYRRNNRKPRLLEAVWSIKA
jgi:hypothetical protein